MGELNYSFGITFFSQCGIKVMGLDLTAAALRLVSPYPLFAAVAIFHTTRTSIFLILVLTTVYFLFKIMPNTWYGIHGAT
jgi:hypothetical protein